MPLIDFLHRITRHSRIRAAGLALYAAGLISTVLFAAFAQAGMDSSGNVSAFRVPTAREMARIRFILLRRAAQQQPVTSAPSSGTSAPVSVTVRAPVPAAYAPVLHGAAPASVPSIVVHAPFPVPLPKLPPTAILPRPSFSSVSAALSSAAAYWPVWTTSSAAGVSSIASVYWPTWTTSSAASYASVSPSFFSVSSAAVSSAQYWPTWTVSSAAAVSSVSYATTSSVSYWPAWNASSAASFGTVASASAVMSMPGGL
jgi:hypothetical protein